MDLVETIESALRATLGSAPAALHEPRFVGREWDYVKECIDTGWVSSVGSYVDRFERDLAAYTGAQHAVVVANGTVGLQVALEVSGIGHGDEVLVPALSFIATANAVSHCGATPHFLDSDAQTLGLSVAALKARLQQVGIRRNEGLFNRDTGRRIAAIVPMHTFGHPVDMPALMEVAASCGIEVIEDAAESLGSTLDARHCGTFGRLGVLSFNGNKIVTTGGGGAILTNDPELARRAKHLTTTAKQPHRWAFVHDEVAHNFRMPNLNAALGCAQLEKIEAFVDDKRVLTERYAQAFSGMSGATLFREREGVRSNYWLQALILDRDKAHLRDNILAATNDAGYATRPVWDLLPDQAFYRSSPCGDLDVARDLASRIINLPSSSQLVDRSASV
ncbi:MAG: LegC family aminotransferase [Pseudomonadota bacterium]